MNLRERFTQQVPVQQQRIMSLWGIDQSINLPPTTLRQMWSHRLADPIAARFVWRTLSFPEQTILFRVLQTPDFKLEQAALQHLNDFEPEIIVQALASLESLLLLYQEKEVICGYEDMGAALLQVGRERFVQEDRLALTFTNWFSQLSQTERVHFYL